MIIALVLVFQPLKGIDKPKQILLFTSIHFKRILGKFFEIYSPCFFMNIYIKSNLTFPSTCSDLQDFTSRSTGSLSSGLRSYQEPCVWFVVPFKCLFLYVNIVKHDVNMYICFHSNMLIYNVHLAFGPVFAIKPRNVPWPFADTIPRAINIDDEDNFRMRNLKHTRRDSSSLSRP